MSAKLRAGIAAIAVVALVAAGVAIARPPTTHSAHHHCIVPGRTRFLDGAWQPKMKAATNYAHSRTGDIAFAVRTRGTFYGYRPDHQEWSASVLKAMLMVAYLDMPSVRG